MHVLSPRCPTLLIAFALLASSFTGCLGSGKDRETGTVRGKVTFNGGPLPKGAARSRVVFEHKEGPVADANIGPDGTYQATVPVGDNGIKVEHAEDMVYPKEGRTGMPMPGKDLIPTKYAHVIDSGLKLTVKPGEQTFDIDIKGDAPK